VTGGGIVIFFYLIVRACRGSLVGFCVSQAGLGCFMAVGKN